MIQISNNQDVLTGQGFVLLVILGVGTVLLVTLFILSFRQRNIAARVDRLERLIGLAAPDSLRDTIGQRLALSRRSSLAGMLLAAWFVMPLALFADGAKTAGTSVGLLLLVGATLAGGAIGTAIGSLRRAAQPDAEATRLARPASVSLNDYVAPLERRGAWIAVGLAALVFFTSLTIPTNDAFLLLPRVNGAMLLFIAVAFLLFFEVMGRRIVNRAQPTGSELELVWDDAMRATDIRDLISAPTFLGFYGALFGSQDLVVALSETLGNAGASTLPNVSAVLAIGVLLAIAVFATASRPERHFLRRLWPHYVNVGSPTTLATGSDAADTES